MLFVSGSFLNGRKLLQRLAADHTVEMLVEVSFDGIGKVQLCRILG